MKTTPPTPSGQDYPSLAPTEDYGGGGSSNFAQRLLVFLRRYWWIPTLTLVLGIVVGVCFIIWIPPVFVSSASMWETERLHLSEGALFTDDAATYIGTQMELLKSGQLRQLTMERLRASGTNAIPLGKDGLPLEVGLQFKELPKSAVFVISATSANAALSHNFLDALMSEYLQYKKSVRKLVSGETAASIQAQVEALEGELKSSQDALTAFQRSNNLAILEEEGATAGTYLSKLQTQLSDLQLESKLLQASAMEQKVAEPTNAPGGKGALDLIKSLDSNTSSPSGGSQLTPFQELELLKIQREKLSKFLRPKHPKIVALDSEIARGEELLELFRSQNHDQLMASQAAVKRKIDSVLTSAKEWETKVVLANNLIAEAEHLKLNVTRAQSHYDRLASLLQNVDITRNTDFETLSVLETASTATRFYRRCLSMAEMSVFFGLAAGLGIVFLIQLRDDRFTSVHEVNSALGDAVVGMLPDVAGKNDEPLRLLEHNDSRHVYAESYRSLRSALLYLATEGERPKVLLITSAVPGEGKSTVAANLAQTLAHSGSRVLLVDGDLRKGRLHLLLNLQGEPGLAELLLNTCDPDKVIQRDALPNFSFIPSGAHVSNAGDLFLASGFGGFLAQWRREFDFVVIDSSPVFAADDVSCLAPKADATLFVVRRDHSSARAVNEALDLLGQRQARVLGVVYNGADASARNYYYYKYHDYGPAVTNGA